MKSEATAVIFAAIIKMSGLTGATEEETDAITVGTDVRRVAVSLFIIKLTKADDDFNQDHRPL